MKVYVHPAGIILTGKGWEIQQKLRQEAKRFRLVKDWTEAIYESFPHPE